MRKKITSVYDLDKRELASQVDLAARTAAPIFRLFGWEWGSIGRIPSQTDIANDLDEKICNILNDKGTTAVSSGRLHVRRDRNAPTRIDIVLELD